MKRSPLVLLTDIVCAKNIVFAAMLTVGALCIFMSASNTTAYLELTGMAHSIMLILPIGTAVFFRAGSRFHIVHTWN
jgi:hypothetical protein